MKKDTVCKGLWHMRDWFEREIKENPDNEIATDYFQGMKAICEDALQTIGELSIIIQCLRPKGIKEEDDIGQQIKKTMERKGIRQRDIAEKMDVDSGFVSKIISGKARPSWTTIQKLMDALDTHIVIIDNMEKGEGK